MTRDRSLLGSPAGLDGPWLAAMLDALDAIHDLLDRRLPREVTPVVDEPIAISEPAPTGPPLPAPPARAGRGASAEAWRDWAIRARVTVPDGASRADIIAACIRAGVLPEE